MSNKTNDKGEKEENNGKSKSKPRRKPSRIAKRDWQRPLDTITNGDRK